MQILTSELHQPRGKINHVVHADWDEQGDLHFVEPDTGEGVKHIWRTDKYEYFFMIHQENVAKFLLYCLWKSFTCEARMTVGMLGDMCNEQEIKYDTDYWM